MLRHFEFFLACRYLRKKRLAFFSILAVALSVAMLIVVTSVMGGFAKQFRLACHSYYGDIIVQADSLMGFPYYEELIAGARELDGIVEATPVIKLPGLLRIDQEGRFKLFVRGVQVQGIEPESYAKITDFKAGLWKQSKLEGPPDLAIPDPSKFSQELYLQRDRLKGACIVGSDVVYNRDADGKYDRQEALYNSSVILTVIALRASGLLDPDPSAKRLLVLIDDFESSVALGEGPTVYIPFDLAQDMSNMEGYRDDKDRYHPPRTSQVQIRTVPGANLEQIREQLRYIWRNIAKDNFYIGAEPAFDIWNQQEGIYRFIAQFERDRTLLTILFGIMGIVSIFLIFCIFFVIVTEKIPDIGIIKSVGASSTGVGRVFLAYALAVGVVGTLLGLAIGWPFVININAIHDWVARTFGWKIYDSRVLLFPDIPNNVDWSATWIIIISALVGSLIGSMIPAIRAAVMKPIKALRYE